MQKFEERNKRKENIANRKLKSSLEALKFAIDKRKIKIEVQGDVLESLEDSLEKPVLENEDLAWPVFFLYPEHSTSDYIEGFNENTT